MATRVTSPSEVLLQGAGVVTINSDGSIELDAATGEEITVKDVLLVTSGSASAPAVAFSGDTDTGLYLSGADTLALTLGGTTGGAVVGTTATQTLTNKTLTSPTITGATLSTATLTAPTVADLSNMTHTHTNAAGGGQLTDAALSSAVTVAKGGTGATTLTGLVKGNGTSAMTAVTAPSGAVVGDTDSQTLTNKTLTAPTITSPAISGASTTVPIWANSGDYGKKVQFGQASAVFAGDTSKLVTVTFSTAFANTPRVVVTTASETAFYADANTRSASTTQTEIRVRVTDIAPGGGGGTASTGTIPVDWLAVG